MHGRKEREIIINWLILVLTHQGASVSDDGIYLLYI